MSLILDEPLDKAPQLPNRKEPRLPKLPWGVKILIGYFLLSWLWFHGMLLLEDEEGETMLSLTRNPLYIIGYGIVGVVFWQLRKATDGLLKVLLVGYLIALVLLFWTNCQWILLYGASSGSVEGDFVWWLLNGPAYNLWFQSIVWWLLARCLLLRYPNQATVILLVQWAVLGSVLQLLYGSYLFMNHEFIERSHRHLTVLALLGLTLITMIRQWPKVVPHQRKVLISFFVFNAWLLPFWYAPYIPKEAATFASYSWLGVLLVLYWSWEGSASSLSPTKTGVPNDH